ncbi:MAG: MBOAT family protein [Lachnospiraceae bacterium]|nr:MBOAT family protein [Lachnospiraceae bacterium]
MVFSSMLFLWAFLPIVFLATFFAYQIGREPLANALLLVGSLFFYALGEPSYIGLMLAVIAINWVIGLMMEQFERQKTLFLICAVVSNVGILGFYKYADFAVRVFGILLRKELVGPDIALPIGISFFTFQALSYTIDVYRGDCSAQKNIGKLALYISLFPQLIAGPIVRYSDINEQIDHRILTVEKTAQGIRRFVYGLGKKVLLANLLGECVDFVYGEDLIYIGSLTAWITSIAYMLQIYYDFSGYSDMAIGLGKMFGFEFKENFDYPYTSLSISEYWRRWHISLGTWFREYVYIPLGGNRKGRFRTYVNLLIVFALTGFWHGASFTFLLWGIYHGFFCVVERMGFGKWLSKHKVPALFYSLLVVDIGFVFFRTGNFQLSKGMLLRMFAPMTQQIVPASIWEHVSPLSATALFLGIIGAGLLQRSVPESFRKKWVGSIYEMIFCLLIFLLSLLRIAGNTYNPFIYFRF